MDTEPVPVRNTTGVVGIVRFNIHEPIDFIPHCPMCGKKLDDADQERREVYYHVDCDVTFEII